MVVVTPQGTEIHDVKVTYATEIVDGKNNKKGYVEYTLSGNSKIKIEW